MSVFATSRGRWSRTRKSITCTLCRVGLMLLTLEHIPINPFTTGNPFLGTTLLGFSIGRGSGALKES